MVALPAQAGEMQEMKIQKASDWVLPKDGVAPADWCNVLRGGGRAGFLMLEPPALGQRALIQFTDVAGLLVELDKRLHLELIVGEP